MFFNVMFVAVAFLAFAGPSLVNTQFIVFDVSVLSTAEALSKKEDYLLLSYLCWNL